MGGAGTSKWLGPQAAMASEDPVRCFANIAQGCQRTRNGPICMPCWNETTDEDREDLKREFNEWVDSEGGAESGFNKYCIQERCWEWVRFQAMRTGGQRCHAYTAGGACMHRVAPSRVRVSVRQQALARQQQQQAGQGRDRSRSRGGERTPTDQQSARTRRPAGSPTGGAAPSAAAPASAGQPPQPQPRLAPARPSLGALIGAFLKLRDSVNDLIHELAEIHDQITAEQAGAST